MSLEIAYLVHDLNDAAVRRRVSSFALGGAHVKLAGFFRREPVTRIGAAPAVPLGRSHDAQLAARAFMVARLMVAPERIRRLFDRAQVIVARNLEMLCLAARVRRRDQQLVYECLDIHRTLFRDDPVGMTLRALERRLLAACDLVITSSPAFVDNHFRARQRHAGPVSLVENKLLAPAFRPPPAMAGGPPWRIGWFGMLRCHRTLALLTSLAERAAGQIEVHIAGRPALSELPDFFKQVTSSPYVRWLGPYAPGHLGALYGDVHFAWCIDYFEEGLNSRWLLPNRLYESLAYGAVPIGLSSVATGRWLRDKKVGVVIDDAEADLPSLLAAMDANTLGELRRAVRALPVDRVVSDVADCQRLVAQLRGQP